MMTITYYPQNPIEREAVDRIRQEAQRHLDELNALIKELGYWSKDEKFVNLSLTLKFEEKVEDWEEDGRMLWTHQKIDNGLHVAEPLRIDGPIQDVDNGDFPEPLDEDIPF